MQRLEPGYCQTGFDAVAFELLRFEVASDAVAIETAAEQRTAVLEVCADSYTFTVIPPS